MRDHVNERRRLYARMSDAELKQIRRQDLGDIARRCFDDEVAHRGLDLSAELPARSSEDAPDEVQDQAKDPDLVPVGTFVFPADAKLARALLEFAGIPAYLENEHTLAANWMLTNVVGGLHLLVPAALAEEAGEILRSKVSDLELAAQAEAAPKPPDA